MKRTSLKRSTKPVNKKRTTPRRVSVVRDQDYMDWLKTQTCVACRYRYPGGSDWMTCQLTPSEPAHTVNNGMRSKGADSSCVPACSRHHNEMDGRLSTKITTKKEFAEKYGLDLAAIAAEHYARFKQEAA